MTKKRMRSETVTLGAYNEAAEMLAGRGFDLVNSRFSHDVELWQNTKNDFAIAYVEIPCQVCLDKSGTTDACTGEVVVIRFHELK